METCDQCGKEFKSTQALRGHRLLGHGGLSGASSEGSKDHVPETTSDKPPAEESSPRQPLSGDQEEFHVLLQDCDVRKALDTITQTFFAGDPEDLNHLASVLEDARAYVATLQKRMFVRYWARFIHRDVLPFLEERLSHPEGEKGERSRPGSEFVEDIGWKVEKDKDGDWGPRPGGELTYEKAFRYAATMNATRSSSEDEGEEEEEGSTSGKERYWHDFCRAMGIEELEHDPRFEEPEQRREHGEELVSILDKIFATKTRAEWIKTLAETADFAYAPVNTAADLMAYPQVMTNRYIVVFDHPALSPIKVVGSPVTFSQAEVGPRLPVPELGEHTDEVLLEVGGYSWDEVTELKDLEVI